MRRKHAVSVLLFLSIGVLLSCEQTETEAQSPAKTLSAEAQKIVDYLLADWDAQFRSTSIPLAMRNLGIAANEDLRLQVGEYFRANTDLANNLKWWGANNYILSNDEKIIAKYLMHAYEDEKALPYLSTTSQAVGLPEDKLKERLAFMSRVGFLQKSPNEKLGFALADGYEQWGGPLRFNFHTVTIADGKPFDVW